MGASSPFQNRDAARKMWSSAWEGEGRFHFSSHLTFLSALPLTSLLPPAWSYTPLKVSANNKELKQRGRRRRRRRQWERQKGNRLDQQNNNYARATRFFVHFLAVVARLQRFHVLSRTGTEDNNFLLLNFDTGLQDSTPKKFAYIWRIKCDGISATNFEQREFTFFKSDIFVAVAVAVA